MAEDKNSARGSCEKGDGSDECGRGRIASGAGEGRKPFTGKEHIPSHDGSITMREYQRRVRLFEANSSIDASFRAGKLVEKLTGQAWECCETLDVASLDGVAKLLAHLWAELEPLEHLRIANTMSEFYQKFQRPRGQQFTTYDTSFRAQCLRLKECGAPLEGTVLAYWFLEKANISEDLKRQVLSASGGTYDYNRLTQALVAIVPRVQEDNDKGKWFSKGSAGKAHRVHAVDQDDAQPVGDGGAHEQEDGGEDEAALLEQEAAVLMTHAARKRAAADKNRGYKKPENDQERAARILEMKSRMPCAACKSHGETRYGHWHEDKECPYYNESQQKPKAKPVFVVDQEGPSESDSDSAFVTHFSCNPDGEAAGENEDNVVHSVVLATSVQLRKLTHGLALADTCCARTVAGKKWVKDHLEQLSLKGIPAMVTMDSQPFRLRDGPRVRAFCAVIFPVYLGQSKMTILMRVSVIDQDVPLLVSAKALRTLGAVVDFGNEKYKFKKISTEVEMVQTDTGHIGFSILSGKDFMVADLLQLDWSDFAMSDQEMAFGKCFKDRVERDRSHDIRGSKEKHEIGVQHVHVVEKVGEDTSVDACSEPVLKSPIQQEASNPTTSVDHGPQDGSPQEKSRLREGLDSVDRCGTGGAAADDSRKAQVGVPDGQAKSPQAPSSKLEEICQERVASSLHGACGTLVGTASNQHSSPELDEGSSYRRVGQLRGGSDSGNAGGPNRCDTGRSTYLPELQGENGASWEPVEETPVSPAMKLSPSEKELIKGLRETKP